MKTEGLKLACLYGYGCQQVEKMKVGKELLGFFYIEKDEFFLRQKQGRLI